MTGDGLGVIVPVVTGRTRVLGGGARRLALCAGVLVIATGASAGAATLSTSPGKWASSFCGSIGTWEQSVKTGDARMNKVLNGLQKSGHANLTDVRTQLVEFLTGVESATGHLLRSLKTLGPPPGKNSDKIESILVGGIQRTQAGLVQATNRAKALPTNNAAAFVHDTSAINEAVTKTFDNVTHSFRQIAKYSPPALTAAAKAAPACKKLGG